MTDLLFLDTLCQAADCFFFSLQSWSAWFCGTARLDFGLGSERDRSRFRWAILLLKFINRLCCCDVLCWATWTKFQSRCENRGEKTKDLCQCSFLKHYVRTTVQAPLLFTVKSPLPFRCIWVRLATWLGGVQKWDVALAFSFLFFWPKKSHY